MEVVVLLAAIGGVALIVIPRVRRRRPAGTRKSSPVVATPAVASWTPPDADAWEDDLGWEGEDDTPPAARGAWQQWRATDSPLASEPEPALPSVERWRAQAADWDDDGLGWEGEDKDVAGGNGHVPPVSSPAQPAESAPAFATASAATDVAPATPETGRTFELADDDWDPPVGTSWSVREEAPKKTTTLPARRVSRVHPVLVVALYAAVGIGLVVLASTVLLGGSTDPAPATKETAAPTATPTPDTAAHDAAAREDFTRERTNAVRSHDAAIAAARAAERREAKARAKARERARKQAVKRKRNRAKAPAPVPTPSRSSGGGSTYTPPPQRTYTPPSNPAPSAPAPKRRSVCEFCIG